MSDTVPEALRGPLGVLMIDNFDSFTWNLYQQLRLLGARVTVVRNDALPASALPHLDLSHLVISPGPGHPRTDSGISRDAITYFAGRIPVLGVCMGLECVVDVFGGTVGFAGEIMHGKLSRVRHDARGCFANVPQHIQSTRYHSLSAAVAHLPDVLQVTAVSADSGVIMGVRHRTQTIEAVQYHPESILSEGGDALLKNFLALAGGTWAENPDAGVRPDAPAFVPDAPDHAHATDSAPAAAKDKAPTILEKIYAQRLRDVEHAKAQPGASPADLDALLAQHLAPPLIPVVPRLARSTPALMAEIKRASPSKGDIAPRADAAAQARLYALAGAAVVSVLTEPTWFKGALSDLRLARAAVDTLVDRPALLRKDFVLDEYQIAEARLAGADTVLLIVAMLPPARLKALYAYSLSLGMEPLVEVNNAPEMARALELGAKLVGVNNRNLHDFSVDMGTTTRLVDAAAGRGVVLCALSGISTPADVRAYAAQGVGAVLVGEALMRAPDTRAFIRELLGWPAPSPPLRPRRALVKICGVRSVGDALAAADAGADLIGLVFVPTSKRVVDMETATAIALAIRTRRAQAPPSPEDDDEEEPTNEPWFAQHARALRRTLSASGGGPLLVGVFQDAPLRTVRATAARAQLDVIQLHGAEPASWARALSLPVLRAFHVGADGAGTSGLARGGEHELLLLDAARADGLSGGGGTTLDWAHAAALVAAGEGGGEEGSELPLVLAGGLEPGNVAEAVRVVRPFAVDVSGGVERADKKGKDGEKMRAFVQAAKSVEL